MPELTLDTDRPVAAESPDHLAPLGTAQDNSRNPIFNEKLFALWPGRSLSVLDIGCAGGGFVKSCLDAGHFAAGIEGSDYSQARGRAEWATIPDHLFTGDATEPFTLRRDGEPATFDVVTAWEVMEHVSEEGLPTLMENVRRHLTPGGVWIMSVSTEECHLDGRHYHQTVQPPDWWRRTFTEKGFEHHADLVRWFEPDWVRGPLQVAPGCFHLVVSTGGPVPSAPTDAFEPSDDALLEAARLHVDAGRRFDDTGALFYARMLLDRLIGRQGNIAEASFLRAQALFELGRLADARFALEMLLREHPDHADARDLLERANEPAATVAATEPVEDDANDEESTLLREVRGAAPLRILVVDDHVPRAGEPGRVRTFLETLVAAGHQPTLLATEDDAAARTDLEGRGVEVIAPAPGTLEDHGREPCPTSTWLGERTDRTNVIALPLRATARPDACELQLGQVRRALPDVPVVLIVEQLSPHDDEGASDEIDRWALDAWREREEHALANADVILAATDDDAARLRALAPHARVDTFRPATWSIPQHVAGFRARRDLVLWSSGDPARDREALPRVLKTLRDGDIEIGLSAIGFDATVLGSLSPGAEPVSERDVPRALERARLAILLGPTTAPRLATTLAAGVPTVDEMGTFLMSDGRNPTSTAPTDGNEEGPQFPTDLHAILQHEPTWTEHAARTLPTARERFGRCTVLEDLARLRTLVDETPAPRAIDDLLGPSLQLLRALPPGSEPRLANLAKSRLDLAELLLDRGHTDAARTEIRHAALELRSDRTNRAITDRLIALERRTHGTSRSPTAGLDATALREATAALDAACRDPHSATAWRMVGDALQALGRLGEARDARRRATELGAPAPAEDCEATNVALRSPNRDLEHVERLVVAGDLDAAALALLEILSLTPESAASWTAASCWLEGTGSFDAARVTCTHALSRDPSHREARAQLTFLDGCADGYLAAADEELRQGRLELAAWHLLRTLLRDPSHVVAWTRAGVVLKGLDRVAAASTALDTAVAIDPENAAARHARTVIRSSAPVASIEEISRRARRALKAEDVTAAAGHALEALASWPREPLPWVLAGTTLHAEGAFEEALAAMAHAHALDPTCQLAIDNRDAILGRADGGALHGPTTPAARMAAMEQAGTAALDRGEWETAASLLLPLVQRDRRRPDAWTALGRAFGQLGLPEDGFDAFEQALAEDPNHRDARLARARSAWETGRRSEALRDLETLTERSANDDEAHALLTAVRASYLPSPA